MSIVARILRILRKPPRVLLIRVWSEVVAQFDYFYAPIRARSFRAPQLLSTLGYSDIETAWREIDSRPYACQFPQPHQVSSVERERIIELARRALQRRVDLLGSGPLDLGQPIRWNLDYKTALDWPMTYAKKLDYSNLERPSDVKFPWEMSRLQWLMPAAQAYHLSAGEEYAACCRDVIHDWIKSNPYCQGPNWACTMEVAIRIVVWTWFFSLCKGSQSWQDPQFREDFLCSLYLHGEYTYKYLELSEVNGNHYTADLAGLCFAGLFFGERGATRQWLKFSVNELEKECLAQNYPDGVNHEASIPYHRLVLELFFYPALYLERHGRGVGAPYLARLDAMADFTRAYCEPGGGVPVWGDADDARLLPAGSQPLNDHRYLDSLVATLLGKQPALRAESSEHLWTFAGEAAQPSPQPLACRAFPEGGFYVMRGEDDQILIDCGPVGLRGRGGHGHNDCLSLQITLKGRPLVVDSGCFVYTASAAERNNFRSTDYHNTPRVDEQEINRFDPHSLWTLANDAQPTCLEWTDTPDLCRFQGSHSGYQRLADPVTPRRTVEYHRQSRSLLIRDEFEAKGPHSLSIPYHLAPGWEIQPQGCNVFRLSLEGVDSYWLVAEGEWESTIERSAFAPSYGVKQESWRIVFRRTGVMQPLVVRLQERVEDMR